jgi:hypothetical protein
MYRIEWTKERKVGSTVESVTTCFAATSSIIFTIHSPLWAILHLISTVNRYAPTRTAYFHARNSQLWIYRGSLPRIYRLSIYAMATSPDCIVSFILTAPNHRRSGGSQTDIVALHERVELLVKITSIRRAGLGARGPRSTSSTFGWTDCISFKRQ